MKNIYSKIEPKCLLTVINKLTDINLERIDLADKKRTASRVGQKT